MGCPDKVPLSIRNVISYIVSKRVLDDHVGYQLVKKEQVTDEAISNPWLIFVANMDSVPY